MPRSEATADQVIAALDRRYRDLEANVLHISNRRLLMQATDLVMHSPLAFWFQGEFVQKGVAELLIVGDTRTGKTKTVYSLMKHYRHGDFVQGESVSQAGLLGGVEEVGRQRFLKMGRLPLCHRGMICIDEANEMDRELVGKMSGVRSRGVYDVVKISAGSFPCLVRQIWIANTRSDRTVAEYPFGVEAIMDVVNKPEDVARFDIAFCVSDRDVDVEALYERSRNREQVDHVYTSEVCSRMVRWAWSRKPEQIIIPDATEDAILEVARELSERFLGSMPLVVATEIRIKLARLSTAVAAIVGSHDGAYENILVLPAHVVAVRAILFELYTSETMGYDRWSDANRVDPVSEDGQRVIAALGKKGIQTLLDHEYVRQSDIQMIVGEKDAGTQLYREMLLGRFFKKTKRGARITREAITFLQKALADTMSGQQEPNAAAVKRARVTVDYADVEEAEEERF